MKKGILLFVCIVMLLPILLYGEVKQVKVWGKIAGLAGREVVLLDSDYKTEIARVKGNKDRFELMVKVEVGDARPYYLYVPSLGDLGLSMNIPVMYFFIDTENIQIAAKIKDGSLRREWIKGSPAMSEYLAFIDANPCQKELSAAVDVYNIAFNEYNNINQTEENYRVLKQASKRMDSLSVKQSEAFLAMIPENRDSKMLAVIVCNQYNGASVDVLEKIVSQFGEGVQECYPIQKMKKRIAEVKASAVGSMAPEFELKDLEGNLVNLSSFRGKYVLIDFWASWCGPCRKEIPNIKQVYNSFADKGLVVIGVSVDQNEQEWRQAVQEEQVQYLQLSDLEGITWKLYNFNGIPFITLISPEGVILERSLRGVELRRKVEEYLLGDLYAPVKQEMDEINERFNTLVEEYREVKEVMKKAEMWEKVKVAKQKRADFLLEGLKQLEGSELGVSLLKDNLSWLEDNYNVFQSAILTLGNRVPESELKTEIWNRFEKLKAEQLTGEAPDFVLRDKRGKEVRLSSFRGKKEVLLDFWASFCTPCRSQNKEMSKHYKELKKKGIQIISVSLDRDKKKWLAAVKQDQMPWLQLADLTIAGGREIEDRFKVKVLPTVYWIGTDGMIKAKNPKLEDLLR
ncbi:peroxiredoxin family protein [Butyricimonas synergistica]|uniref:peroxiredoxin family protein n=1 Tax=Butyricimonas synergistica TaxID=544644 RepID=UPI0022E7C458|nr:TlpA disulfide reductase family protein [Butyricimonas synergistica]